MYTPTDILEYIYEKNLTDTFLMSMTRHVGGYSIGEIADKNFKKTADSGIRFISKSYDINISLEDPDVINAHNNGQYISAFISRYNDRYNLHFLVHKYPEKEKSLNEEEILHEVIRYMILHTIVALRLDNKEKVRKYCGAPEA